MTKMKGIALMPNGGLEDIHLDRPEPAGQDLLVKVKAISVNPVDTKQHAPADMPRIVGFDVAGVVEEVGSDCTHFRPGDEVYYAGDITRPGGNSEYHLIDERIVGKKPASLSFGEAAALPLTSITAWESLFHRLNFSITNNPPTRLLVVGAAGGVGSIATQLAKVAGLTVIGTASRQESKDWTLEHGSTHVISHREPFLPQLQALGMDAVDAILCLNSVDYNWDNMMQVIKPEGKLCTILGPREAIDFRPLSDKSLTWAFELMFTRPKYKTEDQVKQHLLLNQLSEWIDQGMIKTTVTQSFPSINAEHLQKAYELVKSGKMIGKVVLENF